MVVCVVFPFNHNGTWYGVKELPYYWLLIGELMAVQVKTLHEEERVHEMVDRDLNGSFSAAQLENAVDVVLLCTQSNPSLRPKMSEVVKALESIARPAEQTEESNGEIIYGRSCSFSRSFDGANEASSFIIEAIELSGPR